MPPTLKRVVRLDSIPIRKAVFTDEGYLVDKPVLTTTGIFEYTNPDGSIRRELRLPEDVFAPESLASYKGKPVIITHDAGLVTKDNVHENQVGTILSEGIRDGDDVRAEIVIHDTDEMKDRGYKELSLGYNLDLEETPGEWHGEPYDAIQRNIIINHLALVREARAGEQARLNIDSRDSDTLKGGKSMKKTPKSVRGDGILSKEELEQAIKEYKARRAKEAENEKPVASEPKAPAPKEKAPEEKPAEKPAPKEEVKPKEEEKPAFDEDVEAAEAAEQEPETVEAKIERVKENRNLRDEEGDPKDKLSAMGMIAHQDEDIDTLFDIIDTLLAEREFKMKKDSDDDAIPDRDKSGESVANCDSDDEEEEETFEFEEDEDDESAPEDEEEAEVEETEDFEEDEDDEEVDESAYGDPEDDEDWDEDGDDEDDDWEEEEEEEEEFATDSHDSPIPDSTGEVHHVKKLNSDSVDAVINQRIELGMIGRKLNMDGLEKLGIMAAKRRIVKAVRPNIRLDGKSDAYVNAAYDCAVDEIRKRTHKGVKYQKKQMFNKDSRVREEDGTSSVDARRAMIERQLNRNKT